MQTATRTRNAESSRRSRPGFFPEAQAAAPDALVTTLALNVWAPAVTASTALAAALGGPPRRGARLADKPALRLPQRARKEKATKKKKRGEKKEKIRRKKGRRREEAIF